LGCDDPRVVKTGRVNEFTLGGKGFRKVFCLSVSFAKADEPRTESLYGFGLDMWRPFGHDDPSRDSELSGEEGYAFTVIAR
jgi:hypothetical protein